MSPRAPAFAGLSAWCNSPPLSLDALRGRVVILDFWTYSCINCLRTLPHLQALHERYASAGLVLVGVHAPEFSFEKEEGNVRAAVQRLGIPYPVALDPEGTTWKRYGNRYWPRQALISPEGRVAWEHTGEGGYEELEELVRTLLQRQGKELPPPLEEGIPDHEAAAARQGISPELYAGSLRNPGLGSSGVCGRDGVCRYLDQAPRHERDILYPAGEWVQRGEQLLHTGKEGSLALRYRAREVHAVLDGRGILQVLLDGKPASQVQLDGPRLYTLVRDQHVRERELLLQARGPLQVYAFTFG